MWELNVLWRTCIISLSMWISVSWTLAITCVETGNEWSGLLGCRWESRTRSGVFHLQLKVCIAILHLFRYQLLSLGLFHVDAILQGMKQLLLCFCNICWNVAFLGYKWRLNCSPWTPSNWVFELNSVCLFYTKSSFLLCYCEHFLYNCTLVFCRKLFCFLHRCSLQKLYNCLISKKCF